MRFSKSLLFLTLTLSFFVCDSDAQEQTEELTFVAPSVRSGKNMFELPPAFEANSQINPLTKKADAGDIDAMYELAVAHEILVDFYTNTSESASSILDNFEIQVLHVGKKEELLKRVKTCDELKKTHSELAGIWMEKAAGLGHVEAQVDRAYQLFQQHKDAAAIGWARKAAASDSASGHVLLGWAALKGRGVEQEDDVAYQAFTKGAEDGNLRGMRFVAECLIDGRGVESDAQAAFDWYMKIGDGGDPKGWYLAAMLKYNGVGMEVDESTALKLLEKAGNAGVTDAMFWYGTIAFQHEKFKMAAIWYFTASMNGGPAPSRVMSGFCSYCRKGGSPSSAMMAWSSASAEGDTTARSLLKKSSELDFRDYVEAEANKYIEKQRELQRTTRID